MRAHSLFVEVLMVVRMRSICWRLLGALVVLGGLVLGVQAPAAAAPSAGFNDWDCRPSAARPRPVLLLHGLGGNGPGNFIELGPRLKYQGYCVFAPTYGRPLPSVPVGGLVSITESSREIADIIDHVLDTTGAAQIDLVGHSEGGFQALYVPKFVSGAAAKIAHAVALAPPTHGTSFAHLVEIARKLGIMPEVNEILAAFGCIACTELTTGGPRVTELITGPIAQPGIAYTIIASKADVLVTPFGTSFVHEPGVKNITIQDRCPLDPVGHIGLAFNRTTETLIYDALDPNAHVWCGFGPAF